jgi:hypothetical protein
MARSLFVAVLALLPTPACAVVADPFDDGACTMIACADGLDVEFSFQEKGAYVFELTVDGVKTTCTATLPLVPSPPAPCDRPDVFLTLSGSMLPADQQSIGGLHVGTTTARRLALRVTRDGATIGSLDQDVTWVVTPGPNGPRCEPKECRRAALKL